MLNGCSALLQKDGISGWETAGMFWHPLIGAGIKAQIFLIHKISISDSSSQLSPRVIQGK